MRADRDLLDERTILPGRVTYPSSMVVPNLGMAERGLGFKESITHYRYFKTIFMKYLIYIIHYIYMPIYYKNSEIVDSEKYHMRLSHRQKGTNSIYLKSYSIML